MRTLSIAAIALLLTLLTGCGGVPAELRAPRLTPTDVAVFKAVVGNEAASNEAFHRAEGRPIIVHERTLPVCAPRQHRCVGSEEVDRMAETGFDELRGTFRLRNATAITIGKVPGAGLALRPSAAVAEMRQHFQYPGGVTIVEFSLPVYASQDVALVYVRYDCGPTCGTCWFLRLKRSAGGAWEVASQHMLSII
jgi:hypothetical protein